MDGQPGIVQTAGGLGQEFPADFHHQGVDLRHINVLDLRVTGQLPDYAAVPGADHQDISDMRVDSHGDVGDHLMVDEFILFRQHHVAVQRQKTAEFRGIKHIDALIFTFSAVELPVYPDRKFNIRGLRLRKPEFHVRFLLSIPRPGSFGHPGISLRYWFLLSLFSGTPAIMRLRESLLDLSKH